MEPNYQAFFSEFKHKIENLASKQDLDFFRNRKVNDQNVQIYVLPKFGGVPCESKVLRWRLSGLPILKDVSLISHEGNMMSPQFSGPALCLDGMEGKYISKHFKSKN